MKKVLAVVLAVMMLFATVAVGASAVTVNEQWFGGEDPIATQDQVVFYFYFNGGTNKGVLPVYNTTTGNFVETAAGEVSGTYIMLPADDAVQKAGYYITLPQVTPPDGRSFAGWQCMTDRQYYVGGTQWAIPVNAGGTIIEFQAAYDAAEAEEDTLQTILGILIKVFGAIIGIVLYSGNTDQGVAMMEKVLGGIF